MSCKRIFLSIILAVFFCSTTFFASQREIVDTEGRVVKIPKEVKRAVVLTATCIEVIYIFGAIDKVVGITKISGNPIYYELIKELKKISIVSQTEQDINIEKLLALKPDIVIGLGPDHPQGMKKELIERIELFGIPVVLVDLESLNDNYYLIELMGRVFNSEKKARELVNYMKNIVRQIQKKVQKIPKEKRVKVLSVSGDKPTYIMGGYWGDEDVRVIAGGINVAQDIKQFAAVVSLEQINAWNPDVITISHSAKYESEDILQNPQWKNINAVKNRRIYKNPYHIGGIFTPRVVLILSWYAKKFYPELNIDWVKIADDFFKKFYKVAYFGPKE